MDTILSFALMVYFLYHVMGKADLTRAPRTWARRVLPRWAVYPLGCALCFGWWASVGTTLLIWFGTGSLTLSLPHLFASPVVVMVLDHLVRALEHFMVPPLIATPGGTTTNGSGYTYSITYTPSPPHAPQS